MQMSLLTIEILVLNFWSDLRISITYYCNEWAHEPFLFNLFWVLLNSLDMYMFWICFDLWVGTIKLGRPCRFNAPTWSPPLTSVSYSLSLNSILSPSSATVVLLNIYICMYIVVSRHFACLRPTPLVCFHHISDGGFSLCVVVILSVFAPWLPPHVYIAYVP